MLISLEMLLRKAEEWEKYAARHSSLRAEMELLSGLIHRWRELELRSWEQLLRCKEFECAHSAMKHWFILALTLNTKPDTYQNLAVLRRLQCPVHLVGTIHQTRPQICRPLRMVGLFHLPCPQTPQEQPNQA